MRLILGALAACAALPALAAPAAKQQPTPQPDKRIEVVVYSDKRTITLHGAVGAALAVELSPFEKVLDAWSSDTKDMKKPALGEHFIILKAERPIPPLPVFVRTQRADGSERLYPFVFSAVEPPTTTDAISGEVHAATDAPYVVRLTYPGDAAQAQRAAWAKRQAWLAEQRAAEVLRAPTQPPQRNTNYSIEAGR